MAQQLGTFELPIYASLPATGKAGQIVRVSGVLYHWDGGGWVALWPLFISPTAPTTTASKYLWVNTSGGAGTNATLYVEDGT